MASWGAIAAAEGACQVWAGKIMPLGDICTAGVKGTGVAAGTYPTLIGRRNGGRDMPV